MSKMQRQSGAECLTHPSLFWHISARNHWTPDNLTPDISRQPNARQPNQSGSNCSPACPDSAGVDCQSLWPRTSTSQGVSPSDSSNSVVKRRVGGSEMISTYSGKGTMKDGALVAGSRRTNGVLRLANASLIQWNLVSARWNPMKPEKRLIGPVRLGPPTLILWTPDRDPVSR